LAATIVATVAAGVAVRLGVALARAERDRRWARARRARDHELGLWPGERLAEGLKRMALGQLDLAIELLEGDREGVLGENTVHETRKAFKRLRALIRLLEGELGEKVSAREDALLRDAGRRLAGTRDAEVLANTLEGLLERHHAELARSGGLEQLRGLLVAERNMARERVLGDMATRAQVLGELRAARGRVAAWSFPGRAGIDTVEPGLRRLYRQGRRRLRRAAAGAEADGGRAMHLWRKRVKDLRYAGEMLDRRDLGPDEHRGRPGRGESQRNRKESPKEAGRIRRLARRADELGELLGEEHDLALLAERVRAPGEASQAGRGRARKTLLKLIARRRRRLRRRALRQGERLYRRRPRRFVARMRAAYMSARQ
jgi:CHAD domain